MTVCGSYCGMVSAVSLMTERQSQILELLQKCGADGDNDGELIHVMLKLPTRG